mmetsp:Transcript_22971/g.40680  ORF Transcript_22971/g.40680 Transcript_22971/m.40680 type:complete len:315 (+) Transcript_22971:312-1256(+)
MVRTHVGSEAPSEARKASGLSALEALDLFMASCETERIEDVGGYKLPLDDARVETDSSELHACITNHTTHESKYVDDVESEHQENSNQIEAAELAVVSTEESDSSKYIEHIVLPADTLGGLELRYGVPSSVIRQVNHMTSDRLTSHLTLKIPKCETFIQGTQLKPTQVVHKDTEKAQMQHFFSLHFPGIGEEEIECYLSESKNNLREAIRLCKEDRHWERKNIKLLKQRMGSGRNTRRGFRGWLAWFLRKRRGSDERQLKQLNHASGPSGRVRKPSFAFITDKMDNDPSSPAERNTLAEPLLEGFTYKGHVAQT